MAALRSTPQGLSPAWRKVLVATVVVQVLLVVTVALVTALDFHFMAPIDEENHFSYVQQIAQHGTLPVLGRTENSLQGLAMIQGRYPRPTTEVPAKMGLWGLTYEAFQPPLYYLSAVPAYDTTGNFIDKVYAIRLYDMALFLLAVALAARLARVVLEDRWLIGWSMMLVFFALPGVVVRSVTISNLPLAIPLTVLFGTELTIAWKRHSGKRLVGAGAVAGLCVLTELELLVLVPVLVVVVVAEAVHRLRRPAVADGNLAAPPASETPTRRERRERRERQEHPGGTAARLAPLVAALAVPLVLMAPWFAFNEANYHMLTAGPIAIREQTPYINPGHVRLPLAQLPDQTVPLLDPTLPQEWGAALVGQPALSYLDTLLGILVVPAGLVVLLALGRRLWTVRSAILGLPWLLTIVELWYIRFGEQWQVFSRYTYPSLPLLIALVAEATGTFRNRALPVMVNIAATCSVAAIWGYLIFAYTGPWALQR
jgi:hypothetical protein